MYLHIGNDCMIRTSRIVAVLDIDNCTSTDDGREMLARFLRSDADADERKIVNVRPGEIPKSMILCQGGEIYISLLSSAAVRSRMREAGGKTFDKNA